MQSFKKWGIFGIIAVVVLLFLGLLIYSETTQTPFTYEYDAPIGGIIITGHTGNSSQIEIPRRINRRSVVRIEDEAFANNQLVSVVMPDSVTHIGDWAFVNNQLESVTIGHSVTNIGSFAFRGNPLDEETRASILAINSAGY